MKNAKGRKPTIADYDKIKFVSGKPIEPEHTVPATALNAALRTLGIWDRYKAMNTMSRMDKYILLFGPKEIKEAVLIVHQWKQKRFSSTMKKVGGRGNTVKQKSRIKNLKNFKV